MQYIAMVSVLITNYHHSELRDACCKEPGGPPSTMEAYLYMWQAKSVCSPSSREMSSLENVSPGMRPRFFSQKIAQKLPLKKIPSTQANATTRCAKESSLHCNHTSQSSSRQLVVTSVALSAQSESLRKATLQAI